MHGPDEVAFAVELFGRVEPCSACRPTRVKLGIMDEERRTTRQPQGVHRRAAASGSPSSTPASSTAPATRSTPSMQAGPMVRKGDMKARAWIQAYEDCNVDIGLGLRPARPGPDRQGHVGDARPDGRHAGAEDRPPAGRREHRLGAVADGGDAARHSTTTRSTSRQPAGAAWPGSAADLGRPADDPGASRTARGPRTPAGDRQQRAGHPRLRRALGRPGRRLLEGARHQRRRPDGGPRDPAAPPSMSPTGCTTASSPRTRSRRPSAAWQSWSTSRTPATRPTARWRPTSTADAFQAARDLVLEGRSSLRLHRADPPPRRPTEEDLTRPHDARWGD